jgi:hypothetical protein
MQNLACSADGQPKEVAHIKTPDKEVVTYHAHVKMSLKELRALAVLSPEVFGLRAVLVDKLTEVMKPLEKDIHRKGGVPIGEVRLFPDEIAAHVAAAKSLRKTG